MSKIDDLIYQIASDVGELKGDIKGVRAHLSTLNGSVAENRAKVQKHDVVIGKIGLVASAITFAITITIQALLALFKK